MRQILFTCLPVIVLAVGCNKRTSNLPQLSEYQLFPAVQQEAVKSVAASVREIGEAPSDFYVEISSKSPNILVFHLWHKSAFPINPDIVGNPGGKCRDVHYDIQTRKVIKTLYWQ